MISHSPPCSGLIRLDQRIYDEKTRKEPAYISHSLMGVLCSLIAREERHSYLLYFILGAKSTLNGGGVFFCHILYAYLVGYSLREDVNFLFRWRYKSHSCIISSKASSRFKARGFSALKSEEKVTLTYSCLMDWARSLQNTGLFKSKLWSMHFTKLSIFLFWLLMKVIKE